MEKVELKVEGIMCQGCVNRINNILSSYKELNNYWVSLDDKTVTLEINDTKILDDIINNINDLGFKVLKK